MIGRDGPVLEGDGEELDAVITKGIVDHGKQGAETVVVVDDEDVIFSAAATFEEVVYGGDLHFGITQVEVFVAGLACDDVGACGFMPAAFCDAAALGDLFF